MSTGSNRKRPRADLLSSLDAAFASTVEPKVSKYTAQAAAEATQIENKQQAYQQRKRKKKKGRSGGGNGKELDIRSAKDSEKKTSKNEKKTDPLYESMSTELLALGIKDCSLQPMIQVTKKRALHETLRNYVESVMHNTRAGSDALGSLKNKVLSLDNPFKITSAETAEKKITVASKKQTAKLLSARRRRELGLHMLRGEMKYSDAELLSEIWTRYVTQVIESEIKDVQPLTEEVQRMRNEKLRSKFKYLDLSGCPVEVVQSTNPCNLGLNGIIVAETQQTLQICSPASSGDSSNGTISTLMKSESRFKVRISSTRNLLLDGTWFAERRNKIAS